MTRERLRRRLVPVALAAEAVLAGAGLTELWQASAAGQSASRPVVIAAVAAAVGFVATLAAEVVARRRERHGARRSA